MLDYLSPEVQKKLDLWRQGQKSLTGKMMTRATAINALLAKALDGYEPPTPLVDRIVQLEQRVWALEARE